MTEPHIDSRTLNLVLPRRVDLRGHRPGADGPATVRLPDLSGGRGVACPAPEGDDKAAHKYTLQVQRVVYELNAMAAYGLHYLNPADTLDEARQRVMNSYPLPDHIMRLAVAVKALSGLATPAPSAGNPGG